MSLARKSALEAGSQLLAISFSLVSGILISRMLGAEGRGVYVLATALAATVFVAFGDLGMSAACRVFAARIPERLGELHAAAVLVATAAGLALAGGAAVLAPRHADLPADLLAVLPWIVVGVPVLLYQSFWRGLMVGLGDIRGKAVADVLFAAAQLAAIVLLAVALTNRRATPFVVAWYAIAVVSAVLMAVLLGRHGALWRRPSVAFVRDLFAYGRWIYVGDIGARLRLQADQLAAQAFGGEAALGRYNQAASLAGRVLVLPSAVTTAAYQAITASATPDAQRLVAASFRQCLLLAVGLTLAGWVAAPLIPLIYGADFRESITPFRILVPAVASIGMAQVLAAYFSGHLARPRVLAVVNWIGFALQIGLLVTLAPRLGVLSGLAWATAATCATTLALLAFAYARAAGAAALLDLVRFGRGDVERWARLLRRSRAPNGGT